MKANVGGVDRIVRAVVGAVLVVVGVFAKATLGAVAAWAAIIAGTITLLTAVVRFCGLYTLLGFDTCPVETKEEDAVEAEPAPE